MPTWVFVLFSTLFLGLLLWMLYYKLGVIVLKMVLLIWRGLVWLFKKVTRKGDRPDPQPQPDPDPRTGNLSTDETVLLRSAIAITRADLMPDASGLPQDVRDTLADWFTAQDTNLDPAKDRQLLTEIAWLFAGIIQNNLDDLNEDATKTRLKTWADTYEMEMSS